MKCTKCGNTLYNRPKSRMCWGCEKKDTTLPDHLRINPKYYTTKNTASKNGKIVLKVDDVELYVIGMCFKCPNCSKDISYYTQGSRSREIDTHNMNGSARCNECGFKINFSLKSVGKLERVGLSCGNCYNVVDKLYTQDNEGVPYFCKKCMIKYYKKDMKYHKKEFENAKRLVKRL